MDNPETLGKKRNSCNLSYSLLDKRRILCLLKLGPGCDLNEHSENKKQLFKIKLLVNIFKTMSKAQVT